MKELRERVTLPPEIELSEGACSELMTRLVSHLAPGLERSVGPLQWTEKETTGVDWTAEGFVDGALVVVCLRPSSRAVLLLVDPRFARTSAQTSTTILLLSGILGVSAAIGTIERSVWWALLFFVGTVLVWIAADVVLQGLRDRRAMTRLDRAGWLRRFQDAIAIGTQAEYNHTDANEV